MTEDVSPLLSPPLEPPSSSSSLIEPVSLLSLLHPPALDLVLSVAELARRLRVPRLPRPREVVVVRRPVLVSQRVARATRALAAPDIRLFRENLRVKKMARDYFDEKSQPEDGAVGLVRLPPRRNVKVPPALVQQ